MSATEKEALDEMKVQSKSKRPKIQPDTEVQGKRSRAKVLKEKGSSKQPDSTAKAKSKTVKGDLKKKKEQTEAHNDDELAGSSENTSNASKHDGAIDSDTDGSGSTSDSSSDCNLMTIAKRQGKSKDVKRVNALDSWDDDDESDAEKHNSVSVENRFDAKKNKTDCDVIEDDNQTSQSDEKKTEHTTVKTKSAISEIKVTSKSASSESKPASCSRNDASTDHPEVEKTNSVTSSKHGNRNELSSLNLGSNVKHAGNKPEGEQSEGEKKKHKRKRSDGTDDGGERESTKMKKKKRGKKGKEQEKVKLRRNMTIYAGTGEDTYLYSKDSSNVVQIHLSYQVFTLKNVLNKALSNSKSASICCRYLMDHVYTADALQNASAFGYPPRGKGSANVSQMPVFPRLDPNGIDAIIGDCFFMRRVSKSQ